MNYYFLVVLLFFCPTVFCSTTKLEISKLNASDILGHNLYQDGLLLRTIERDVLNDTIVVRIQKRTDNSWQDFYRYTISLPSGYNKFSGVLNDIDNPSKIFFEGPNSQWYLIYDLDSKMYQAFSLSSYLSEYPYFLGNHDFHNGGRVLELRGRISYTCVNGGCTYGYKIINIYNEKVLFKSTYIERPYNFGDFLFWGKNNFISFKKNKNEHDIKDFKIHNYDEEGFVPILTPLSLAQDQLIGISDDILFLISKDYEYLEYDINLKKIIYKKELTNPHLKQAIRFLIEQKNGKNNSNLQRISKFDISKGKLSFTFKQRTSPVPKDNTEYSTPSYRYNSYLFDLSLNKLVSENEITLRAEESDILLSDDFKFRFEILCRHINAGSSSGCRGKKISLRNLSNNTIFFENEDDNSDVNFINKHNDFALKKSPYHIGNFEIYSITNEFGEAK